MYTNENVIFAQLLKEARKERKINMKKLANGLCSPSMISKIESAERYPDKLLRDRLLERMGIAGYDYENFLNADEYDEWRFRQDIVWAIIDGNKGVAISLLDELLDKKDMSNVILRQFYFGMLLQIKRANWDVQTIDMTVQLRSDIELDNKEIVRVALSATVVEPETAMEDTCLCIQEINLLLEYWKMLESSEEKVGHFEKLGKYLFEQSFDDISISELYPKIVYYIYIEVIENLEMDSANCQYILRLLNKAIQILGSAKRGYYLWEILLARKDIYEKMIVILEKEGYSAYSRIEALKKLEIENERLLETLEYSYGLVDVEKQMTEDAYLYIEYDVACIADVIRQRRQTLGMSMRELAEGICNLETLEDIEHKRTNPHMATVQDLFKKLNLSTELKRAEVVTDNPKTIHYVRKLKFLINSHVYDEAEEYIRKLKEIVPLDIPLNRQFVLRAESLVMWRTGRITKNEYLKLLREAIGYTIPYERLMNSNIFYLTKEELLCIENSATIVLGVRKRVFTTFLEKYCNYMETSKINRSYISQYKTLLSNVANQMGSMGDYDTSNRMSKKVIALSMKLRMLFPVESDIYNILWNQEQMVEISDTDFKLEREKILGYCLELAKFCSDVYSIDFYKKKMI